MSITSHTDSNAAHNGRNSHPTTFRGEVMDEPWLSVTTVRPVKAQDGSTIPAGTLVMRRRENGKWVYRLPTDEEETDYVSQVTW